MVRILSFVFSACIFCFSASVFSQTLLFSDDFESGFGNWVNVTSGDNKQWSRDSAGTPSSGTGPSTGAGSSYYLYLETSSGAAYTNGDTAILLGPPVSASGIRLMFQYHMYGSNMGSLNVDVLDGGVWINNVWSISGQQHTSNGASYTPADVDLSMYSVSQIRMRAVAIGGFLGDMAVDNVEIWSAPIGPLAPVFNSDPISKAGAIQDQSYSETLAADASDGNGDVLTFSKLSGPAWLSVASDGTLSGTPDASDVGLNEFVVQVSDGGLDSSATLSIDVADNTTPIILFSDDFEQGYGNWVNTSSGDNSEWTRDSAGTTSSGTGPSTGADNSTYYVYLETSSGYAYSAGDTAYLVGPLLSGADVSLSFRYHMYGTDMGTLAVDVFSSGVWINNVWTISGQQHISNSAAYSQADVDLSGYAATQIRFRATAAGNFLGDMAIDDIEIWSVPITGPSAPVFTQDPLIKTEATANQNYSESIAADASDANGDVLTFSKVSGPSWLSISSDGNLSGMPGLGHVGLNVFTVEVSDGALSSTASLEINVDDGVGPVILFSDNFESGFGNWSNATSGDSHNWTLHSGGTSSSNTGPLSGEGGTGSYLYMETSSGSAYTAGNSVILNSPVISGQQIHLAMYYHMYGSDIGTLAVDVYSSGAWVNDVWSVSGQQHSSSAAVWSAVDVDLSAYDVSQLRIRAVAAGGFLGDIGIDSLEISNHFSPYDSDNDGVVDSLDAFPFDPTETVDNDGDLIGNNADTDDDNDGVLDINDAFPFDASESLDTDGDLIGNNVDTDDDNDGVDDALDAFPMDPTETLDADADGIGNNADTDDDNDGVEDTLDAFPFDASETLDSDGDGVGDNADAFPADPGETVDTDGDGIGNNTDTDDDNDGVEDSLDAFPLDPNLSQAFSVGGSLSGLNSAITLSLNGAESLSIDVDGAFQFSTIMQNDDPYSVSVSAMPTGQVCTIDNAGGVIDAANITNINVSCYQATYTLTPTVDGNILDQPVDGIFDSISDTGLTISPKSFAGSAPYNQRAVMEFDLSQLPPGIQLESASLQMTAFSGTSGNKLLMHGYEGNGIVEIADASASETIADVQIRISKPSSVTFDITEYTNSLLSRGVTYLGLSLRGAELSNNVYLDFGASEYAQGAPTLTISLRASGEPSQAHHWQRIEVSADGFATDNPIDGIFDTLNTTAYNFDIQYSWVNYISRYVMKRSVLEFNTASLSSLGGAITFSRLHLYATQTGGSSTTEIDLYGYDGDGLVTMNDVDTTASYIDTASLNTTGGFYYDLANHMQQLQLNAIPYAGFQIRAASEGSTSTTDDEVGIISSEGASPSFFAPYIEIRYEP